MEPLFKTNLMIDGKASAYEVFFEEDEYRFQPESGTGLQLHLRREQDEWHTNDALNEQTKNEAIDALDDYLLSQH